MDAYPSSAIWWDKSWSPVTGCSPISEGCDNCWAKRMTDRNMWGYDFAPRFHPERLSIPLRWQKPRRIFVCSMGDLFHDDVPREWIDKVFAVMALCRKHTFFVLTKRPERMLDYLSFTIGKGNVLSRVIREAKEMDKPGGPYLHDLGWPYENILLGVTAENQATVDERVPILLGTPAAHRFVSIEPCLSSVDLCVPHNQGIGELLIDGLDWVILGGETGPGARPMDPHWARLVMEQCRDAGVPFFMKQMSRKEPIPDDLMVREAVR